MPCSCRKRCLTARRKLSLRTAVCLWQSHCTLDSMCPQHILAYSHIGTHFLLHSALVKCAGLSESSLLYHNNVLSLPIMASYMLIATNEVQTVQQYPQLGNIWFWVSLKCNHWQICLLKLDQMLCTACLITMCCLADVLGHFSFSSLSIESLYIQMHHNKLTLGNDNYRYTA